MKAAFLSLTARHPTDCNLLLLFSVVLMAGLHFTAEALIWVLPGARSKAGLKIEEEPRSSPWRSPCPQMNGASFRRSEQAHEGNRNKSCR